MVTYNEYWPIICHFFIRHYRLLLALLWKITIRPRFNTNFNVSPFFWTEFRKMTKIL